MKQWLRACTLSLSGSSNISISGGGPNDLRIEAAIAASTVITPNPSRFRITNPNPSTIASFKGKEFQQITWEAGYVGNTGVIFQGDVKQSVYAHSDNVVDSYIDIFCYEHGNAHQMSHVNKTLSAGWKPQDKLQLALDAMKPFGITGLGLVNVDLTQPARPRGRAIVGMARDIIREVALSAGALPSMSRGKLNIINHDQPLQSDGPVVLNSQTGQIGFAHQTEGGVVVRCLINPAIWVHTQVQIDQSSVIEAEKNNNPLGGEASTTNFNLSNTGQIAADGLYRVLFLEIEADTRGQPWYMTLTCLATGAHPNESELHTGFN